MGALLDVESRRLQTEQRWRATETAYKTMQRDDAAGWNSYLEELAELTTGEIDSTAAEEWPEYNP